MTNNAKFAQQREFMVVEQLRGRGINDANVLAAMREVPREVFVPSDLAAYAYDDGPLPIGSEQTISQPYIVALMIQALGLSDGDRVLDIGTGSGYAAAVLSRIVAEVYSVERIGSLVAYAKRRIHKLGYENIHLLHSDGTVGWAEHAPYHAILVSASGSAVPAELRNQLAVNGRLVIPVGASHDFQQLICETRLDEDRFERQLLSDVRFVPLIASCEG